ncbi:MAG: glycoside hydrolase family 99-like domain-containing protein [Alphaproteobacteria bacterium]
MILRNNGTTHHDEKSRKTGMLIASANCASSDVIAIRPLFDADFYLSQNGDVARSGVDAITHYLAFGWREGRSPHPLFDIQWYVSHHPEVAEAGVEPLGYFIAHGIQKGHDPHWCFDTDFYLSRLPNGASPTGNPLVHYLTQGAAQGYDPHPLFKTKWYLKCNPDVGVNPLIHFVWNGGFEGRSPHPSIDLRWYRSHYPDAATTRQNLLYHMLGFAGPELRNPSPHIDLKTFSERFPTDGIHPLVHYALHADRLLKLSARELPPKTADGISEWKGEVEFSRRCAEVEQTRKNVFRPRPADLIHCKPGGEEGLVRQLNFLRPAQPTVSVVLPVFNMVGIALECLASLQRFGHEVDYEVIIADDASKPDQSELLSRVQGATYIRNEKNLGFLLNCNKAARSARGKYLLFLNSDVQLLPGALAALVASAGPGVGIVGPKIIYPTGHLQEAGCRVNIDGSTSLIGLNEDPDLPQYNFRRSVEYVSGACLLIERRLFEELDGFDSSYAPAYCEDVDLCFRVRAQGLSVVYEPAACVCHHLSKTMMQLPNDFKYRQANINAQKVAERWQEQIESDNRVSVIAIYLPQFHCVPENDLWWGPGFTEWSNVARATPNYVGHDQPRRPADLGYYDLDNPEIFTKQIALARRYGISAFSFYYYWFKDSRRILERPLETYLANPAFDFPFCLSWANENWTRRWDGAEQDVLLEQNYSEEDDLALIRDVARFFVDPRYVRIEGRPLFSVYRWALLPDPKATAQRWRAECRRLGIGEIHLCAVESFNYANELRHPADIGCDATIGFPAHGFGSERQLPVEFTNPRFRGFVDDYLAVAVRSATRQGTAFTRFPGVTARWDNTARRQDVSYILEGADPGGFKAWLEHACNTVRHLNSPGQRFVFINAWNEWAEGAYLEPDTRYGHAYLTAIRQALDAPIARRSP